MMRFPHENTIVSFGRLLLVLAGVSLFSGVAIAQPGPNTETTLRPGIVVDPTTNVVYAMTPDGITAIDVATGTKRWTSTAAHKPLAIAGNLLISQVEPTTVTSRLDLVVLDTREGGAPKARNSTTLPSFVRVGVSQNLEGIFSAEAEASGNTAVVTWSFQRRPLKGMPEEEPNSSLNTLSVQDSQAKMRTEGAVQMNLTTGALNQVSTPLSVTTSASQKRWMIASSDKISGVATAQYESADGRHVMASERIADDRVWDKYRWIVFERATNRRVGEFRTHVSFTPFVIRDSTLVYETTPYIRGGNAQPAKLRGVSLSTGAEVWGVEVRELVYRGPYPP